MYQLLPDTPMGAATCIKRIADNAFIPFDQANTDYQQYKKWIADGNTPMPVESTQVVQAIGTAGADTVTVPTGAQVDASQLGLGNDKIILSGNLSDYTQSIDQSTGIYTLTRQINGKTESVKFLVSDEDDVITFADGYIVVNAANDIRLYDGEQFFPLQSAWLTK